MLAFTLINFDAGPRLNLIVISLSRFVGHLKFQFLAVIGENRKIDSIPTDDGSISLRMYGLLS